MIALGQKPNDVRIRKVTGAIGTAGVGFVVIPEEKEREQYIEDCYRTQTVTIQGGQGYGYFSDVHVDERVMQSLVFPPGDEENNRGSAVVWIKDEITGLPIIIASLRNQDDYYALNQGQGRWAYNTTNGSAEVFIDGAGMLNVNLTGSSNTPSVLNIKVSSDNADSKINISSDSEINVQCDKKINIISADEAEVTFIEEGEVKTKMSYKIGRGVEYKDEFENEIKVIDGKINAISKEIIHNEGNEPMVLGDTLANILNDILDKIMALTVMTAVGTSTIPVNVADFAAIKAKVDTIKSKKSKLE